MSYLFAKNCLRCSLFIAFLLFYQVSFSQYNFSAVSGWVKNNLSDLGGRAVLMIYKDGKIIYNESFNHMNTRQKIGTKIIARKTGRSAKELQADYDENSKIALASCSKWLSAAVVMSFVDEGKLKVTDTIGKFLPVMTANGKGNITIAQCLSHTTGIKGGSVKESREWMNEIQTMDEAVAAIAKQPMESKAGGSFHYSSIGLQLAAAVIEKISNQGFEYLFRQRIALPCDMINTSFGQKAVTLPAGGASGTATDYLHFLQMILHKGVYNGKRVLSENSVRLMQQNHAASLPVIHSPAQAGDWRYGFGEWVMEDATDRPSDAVTSPGLFGSFPWVDNKNGYAALLFTTNLRSQGRGTRYKELKQLVDNAISHS